MLGGTILVTGGAGFIGSHLVDALVGLEGVEKVVVIDDLSYGRMEHLAGALETGKLEFLRGDITEEETVVKVFREHRIDYVFHEAALVGVRLSMDDPWDVHRVNVGGSLAILRAVMDLDADVERLILASSCVVYGEAGRFPIREEDEARPKSPYGASKLAAEAYWTAFHRAYGLRTVVLRYFNVYGPRQRPGEYGGVISSFISRVVEGEPPIIYGDGEQTRDFVHVRDVVEPNILAALKEGAVGEVFN
ncbi:hypothetical protein DRO32_04060, partial [Candidatus Bathyarchaeota archaeon]